MRIYVNEMAKDIALEKVSYSQAVLLALYHIPVNDRICPTVSYCLPSGKEYTAIQPRSSVRICAGMKFIVLNGKKVSRGETTSLHQETPAIEERPAPDRRAWVKPEALERGKAKLANNGLGWPPHMTAEQIVQETERVRQLMAPHEERYQARMAARTQASSLTETEAQLKDAYVIIHLLYQEAVEAGRMTPGRRMAGTLLYSARYQEIVKKLENPLPITH